MLKKTKFDPANKDHRVLFARFLKENTWGKQGCPFEPLFPWSDVVMMCHYLTARYFIEQEIA